MMYFINCIFVDQLNGQNDGAVTPRRLHPSRASSPIYNPPRMPTFIWLLYIFRKRQPPKANAPPISLFFDVDLKFIPNKGNGSCVHKPSAGRLQQTHGETQRQDLGVPLLYPCRERVKPLGVGRQLILLVVVYGKMCVVFCVVLWLWASLATILVEKQYQPSRNGSLLRTHTTNLRLKTKNINWTSKLSCLGDFDIVLTFRLILVRGVLRVHKKCYTI